MAHWGRQRVIGVGKLPTPMRGFLPQWNRRARDGVERVAVLGAQDDTKRAGLGRALGAAVLAS